MATHPLPIVALSRHFVPISGMAAIRPLQIGLFGTEVAILWEDGRESYISAEDLRRYSPSADNIGEPDIMGRYRGGNPNLDVSGILVEGYEPIGNYALRFIFSDGHGSGLYSFNFLRRMVDHLEAGQPFDPRM